MPAHASAVRSFDMTAATVRHLHLSAPTCAARRLLEYLDLLLMLPLKRLHLLRVLLL